MQLLLNDCSELHCYRIYAQLYKRYTNGLLKQCLLKSSVFVEINIWLFFVPHFYVIIFCNVSIQVTCDI